MPDTDKIIDEELSAPQIFDATKRIDDDFVDYVFGPLKNKIKYIELFDAKIKIPRTNSEANEIIKTTWDYEKSKDIIRKIFKKTDKYINGKASKKALDEAYRSWNAKKLGKIDWPFSAMAFDQFVQSINTSSKLTEDEKDEKVSNDCIKFRRIKELNTFRNDYLEYLIFENNNNIIPTLVHRKGIDFFIDGKPYDQKVSRSATKQFEEDFGGSWKDVAMREPEKVAQYLYEMQDEERFGFEPRLLLVYIDQNVSSAQLEKIIASNNLTEPITLHFAYNHKKAGLKRYSTSCFIIILHS